MILGAVEENESCTQYTGQSKTTMRNAKMNKTITGLLSVFAIIGWTETALAEDYTGCVTPGGTIIEPCSGPEPGTSL